MHIQDGQMTTKKQLLALVLSILAGIAQAGEKEELLKLRNTTTNLIMQLVKQGVLTEKLAEEMIKQAEADAAAQVKEQTAAAEADKPEPGEVRVPYVPEFVKDDIRQQVRAELRKDVVSDVMQEAKNQKWGVPDALPEWVNRFKLSGDIRLRSQNEFMGDDNTPNSYFDYQTINQRGGFTAAGLDRFLNTTEDRHRFRERFRLGIDAKITDGIKAGIRLATSNLRDPVSTNQSLGNTGGQFQFNVDRAYLQYDDIDNDGFKWLTLDGGRIKNPWFVGGGEFTAGSELVWDTDLSFEGFAATVRHRLAGSGSLDAIKDHSDTFYATVGAFPLQEFQLSAKDKWLFGGQVGFDWGFDNQNKLKVGVAYFDYVNVEAKPNIPSNRFPQGTCDLNDSVSRDINASRPEFLQGGNTIATICRESELSPFPGQVGLASDFNIINANLSYDIAAFAPYHIILGADYAKNIGFNQKDVSATRILNGGRPIAEQTDAWQVRVDVGWPKVELGGNWNVFALYKYVGRDSVLDAFTDSDFRLGGTNSKGWVIGGNYGLAKNIWFTGRWLTADVITGPPFGIDTLQIDINTRF
jgi:Putative porin